MKQYKCPKCGAVYTKLEDDNCPPILYTHAHMAKTLSNGRNLASFLSLDREEYYCKACLFDFLAEVYKPFLLEEV